VIGARWSRLRRVSLPQFKFSSAEARFAPSAFCVFSEVSAVALDADAPSAQADNQLNRFSVFHGFEAGRKPYLKNSHTAEVPTSCRIS
jgi:hypothetical protein